MIPISSSRRGAAPILILLLTILMAYFGIQWTTSQFRFSEMKSYTTTALLQHKRYLDEAALMEAIQRRANDLSIHLPREQITVYQAASAGKIGVEVRYQEGVYFPFTKFGYERELSFFLSE